MQIYFRRIREYFKLMELSLAAYTAIIPVSGVLAMGVTRPDHLFLVFCIGLFSHIRGSVLNDYFDIEIDKHSSLIGNKPLAIGTISKASALWVVGLALVLYWLLIGLFFANIGTVLMAVVGPLLGTLYNRYGKVLVGVDLFLSANIFCNCLLGAFTVSVHLSPIVIFIGLIWALDWLYLNQLTGLRDVEFDRNSGATSLPLSLGALKIEGRLYLPPTMKILLSAIRVAQLFLLILAGHNFFLDGFEGKTVVHMVLFTALIGATVFLHLKSVLFQTEWLQNLKKLLPFISGFVALLIMLLLMPFVGYRIAIPIFFLVPLWFIAFNRLIYSSSVMHGNKDIDSRFINN